MKPAIIQLIFQRELRDQLRDRRTILTVLVLPLLIYPLLSLGFMQVAQLASAPTSRILLLGANELPLELPLVDGDRIQRDLLDDDAWELTSIEYGDVREADIARFIQRHVDANGQLQPAAERQLRDELARRRFDLLVVIPPGFADSIAQKSPDRQAQIMVLQNSTDTTSMVAARRFQSALDAWNRAVVMQRLAALKVDVETFSAAKTEVSDLAGSVKPAAIQWARILPLLLVVWALTGAFYPAIDLCAGEKERGTLETLLCSPATRLEIVGGKLLAVMCFSVATAILNMVSLLVCGSLVAGPLEQFTGGSQIGGLPPWDIYPVLLCALMFVAALFSSLALAIAAFARSTKEGQYYLMPLIMVTFPLMVISMLPGSQLGLGTALIPLTGLLLLIQAVVNGSWQDVGTYSGPVVAVTLVCCWLAVKWCVHQFNDERIMLSQAERFSLGNLWRRWLQARQSSPTVSLAITCAAVVLVARFYAGFWMQTPASWQQFWPQTLVVLVGTVALPAVVLAWAFTRQARETLLLREPQPWMILAVVLLAMMMHPAIMSLSRLILWLYPLARQTGQTEMLLQQILAGAPGFWAVLAVVALAPAICEELAFRGLILNGLRSRWNTVHCIWVSSLLFGLAHGIIQQTLVTFFIGIVLGLIAVRTSSLVPCIVYHFVHNGLSLGLTQIDAGTVAGSRWLRGLFELSGGEVIGYQPTATISASIAATMLLWILFNNTQPSAVFPALGKHREASLQRT